MDGEQTISRRRGRSLGSAGRIVGSVIVGLLAGCYGYHTLMMYSLSFAKPYLLYLNELQDSQLFYLASFDDRI